MIKFCFIRCVKSLNTTSASKQNVIEIITNVWLKQTESCEALQAFPREPQRVKVEYWSKWHFYVFCDYKTGLSKYCTSINTRKSAEICTQTIFRDFDLKSSCQDFFCALFKGESTRLKLKGQSCRLFCFCISTMKVKLIWLNVMLLTVVVDEKLGLKQACLFILKQQTPLRCRYHPFTHFRCDTCSDTAVK